MTSEKVYDDVTNEGCISTAKLEVGESFEAKLIKTEPNKKRPENTNWIMEDEDGEELLVFPSGNLKYAIKDGKVEIGRTYLITRIEDKLAKNGKMATQFRIQRLRENGEVAAPKTNTTKPKGKSL